jgi:RES domain-containing protein/uncharacterized protein (DUF2384 family)
MSVALAGFLGGRRAFAGRLSPTARPAVRFAAAEELAHQLELPVPALLAVIGIEPRTALRRRAEGTFRADEADRLLRVARVALRARQVLGSMDRARRWLKRGNRVLGGHPPLPPRRRARSRGRHGRARADRVRRRRVVRAWRLTRRRYAAAALSGLGARRFGSRWSSKGTAVVYASTTRALAVLEMLVHLDLDQVPGDLVLVPLAVPDGLVGRLDEPPRRWRDLPYVPSVQRVGDRWVASGRSLGLLVPSAILPREDNLLVNPVHPAIGQATVEPLEAFSLDPRLLARRPAPGSLPVEESSEDD